MRSDADLVSYASLLRMGGGRAMPRGFLSFDALFSLIPMTLIVLYAMSLSAMLIEDARYSQEEQILFDKLVSAADFSLKIGLAKHSDDMNTRYPNLIAGEPDDAYTERLRESEGLGSLLISFQAPDPGAYSQCIYRLVLTDPDGSIRKLHFCGDP